MYNLWMNIKERCELPSNRDYPDYGGRGIRCEFASFTEFLHTMGEKPGPEYSLGRIDNDGPYSPTNCAWQTAKEQANNRRGNVLLTFKEETKTLTIWAEHLGLLPCTLWRRLYVYHWPLSRALTEPLNR